MTPKVGTSRRTTQAQRASYAEAVGVYDPAGMIQHVTETLAAKGARVIDLFRAWDDDRNGMISRLEFRRALPMLGMKVDRLVVDQLFDSFDADKSGEISYEELKAKLTAALLAKSGAQLDEKLKAGAMGEITVEAKNKHALRKGPRTDGGSGVIGSQIKLLTGEGAPPIIDHLRRSAEESGACR